MTPVFIGIDIGGTNTKLAAVAADGRVLRRGMIRTSPGASPEALFERVASVLPRLVPRGRRVAGAGLGCAGLVDPVRGRLLSAPNLPAWSGAPVARIARRALGVYIHVDNDANAAAYGEYRAGAGRGAGTFVCITLGTGVGGGIVVDGKVLRGAANYAGEIGHMTVRDTGPRCKCGNRGCVESFVAAHVLVRRARRRLGGRRLRGLGRGEAITPEALCRAARSGDRVALEVFSEAGKYLGIAIASLINLLNPDRIAIAGGVAGGFAFMRPEVKLSITARAFPESARCARVVRGRLGFDAATVGAALMASQAVGKS